MDLPGAMTLTPGIWYDLTLAHFTKAQLSISRQTTCNPGIS